MSPFIPLLFMGEEYAESSPFQYFVSHGDEDLIHSVREGRRKEFERFNWQNSVPDPQSPETFMRSKLHWDQRTRGQDATLLSFYAHLLLLRRTIPALSHLDKQTSRVTAFDPSALIIERWHDTDRAVIAFNFARSANSLVLPTVPGIWKKLLASADSEWGGSGIGTPSILDSRSPVTLEVPPTSFIVFRLEGGSD